MTNRLQVRKAATALLAGALIFQLLGCGTILYPERRNQPTGQLDTDIVILDGLGLLLFVIPGVIAFGVDFVTGALFLPKGHSSRVLGLFGAVETLEFDPDEVDLEDLSDLIEEETGVESPFEQGRVIVLNQRDRASLAARVEHANRTIALSAASAGSDGRGSGRVTRAGSAAG